MPCTHIGEFLRAAGAHVCFSAVRSVADHAGSIAAGGKESPKQGQAPGMEGPPSGVHYDAGPASGKGAPPAEPAEPPFTTRVHVGDRWGPVLALLAG